MYVRKKPVREQQVLGLGATLRKLREGKGWTVRMMADFSGSNMQAVCNFENGKASLNLDTFARMVTALGYQVEIVPTKEG